MKVYRITTDKSDYPFLVIADNISDAVKKLENSTEETAFPQFGITDSNINNITVLREYNSSNIII